MHGADHDVTLMALNNIAGCYAYLGRMQKAIEMFERVSKSSAKMLGADHPDSLMAQCSLAACYLRAGNTSRAIELLEQARPGIVKSLEPDDPRTLAMLTSLANAYLNAGRNLEAIELFEKIRDFRTTSLGPNDPATLDTLHFLSLAYQQMGDYKTAIGLLEPVRDGLVTQLGQDHPATMSVHFSLIRNLGLDGQHEKAVEILNDLVKTNQNRIPQEQTNVAANLVGIANDLLQGEQFTTAEVTLREALSLREQLQPDEWTTFNTQSMLGGSLLGQNKYSEAEPLLLAGYAGMNDHESSIPAPAKFRMNDALERLVQLYGALQNPDEAAKWKALLDQRPTGDDGVKEMNPEN